MNKYILVLVMTFSLKIVAQNDVRDSSDHELIDRITQSEIKYYYQHDYDEMQFVKSYSKNEKIGWVSATGKHTSIVYDISSNKSPLLVMHNFKKQLLDQQANVVFECKGNACDFGRKYYNMEFFKKIYNYEGNRTATTDHYLSFQSGSEQQQYLLVNLPYNGKQTFVEVATIDHYTGRTYALVEILETDAPLVIGTRQKSILFHVSNNERGKFIQNPQEYLSQWENQQLIGAIAYQNGSLSCEQLHKGIPIQFYAEIRHYDELVYKTQIKEHFLFLGQKEVPNDNYFFPGDLFHELPKGDLQIIFFIEALGIEQPDPYSINFKN